jgi:transcriptional regulator with XRE-family HTH domain
MRKERLDGVRGADAMVRAVDRASRLDATDLNRHSCSVDESQQWVAFGRWLAEQREERGLRRRDAARRAKVSEVLWRDLETGRKEAIGGIRLLPNPSRDVLKRVAGALELPVEDLLARIGRPTVGREGPARTLSYGDHRPEEDGSVLALKLRRLSERDRLIVERVVDTMIENQDK